MKYIPKVNDEVKYPSGSGLVMLPPDRCNVIIVKEDHQYKRVDADVCKPVTEKERKAIAYIASEFECCGVCSSESRERAKHIYKMIIEG